MGRENSFSRGPDKTNYLFAIFQQTVDILFAKYRLR